jgi:hypothetical protein
LTLRPAQGSIFLNEIAFPRECFAITRCHGLAKTWGGFVNNEIIQHFFKLLGGKNTQPTSRLNVEGGSMEGNLVSNSNAGDSLFRAFDPQPPKWLKKQAVFQQPVLYYLF